MFQSESSTRNTPGVSLFPRTSRSTRSRRPFRLIDSERNRFRVNVSFHVHPPSGSAQASISTSLHSVAPVGPPFSGQYTVL